jgi:hypothetical protein
LIPKIDLNDINGIYAAAEEKVKALESGISATKQDMQKKIKILTYALDYASSFQTKLNNGVYTRGNDIKTFDGAAGDFWLYGLTAVPQFIRTPSNVFNLQTAAGAHMFRQDVSAVAKCGKLEYSDFLESLKHDSVQDKKISFYEFESDSIVLTVSVDGNNRLGQSKTNLIEIDPFLPGSFDIETITISYGNSSGMMNFVPAVFNNINSVGQQYIVLDQKYNVDTIEFKLKLKYSVTKNGKKVYPFGLKHLYFRNADFRSDSYAVVRMDRESYIDCIKDKAYVQAATGAYFTTLTDMGIEVYSEYANNILTDRIYPSTDDSVLPIARNTKTLYAKIPMQQGNALIGVSFSVELRSQGQAFNGLKTIYIDRTDNNQIVTSQTEDVVNAISGLIMKYPDFSNMNSYSSLPSVGGADDDGNYVLRENVLSRVHLDTVSQPIGGSITIDTPSGLPFDYATISSANIFITDINRNRINCSITTNSANNIITIKPVSQLEYDKLYILAVNGLKYGSGYMYDFPSSTITFCTESSTVSSESERYAVPCTNHVFSIKFDFDIDFNSVTSEKVFAIDVLTGNKILTSFAVDSLYKNMLNVSVLETLEPGHQYALYVKQGIGSLSGLNMKQDTSIIKFYAIGDQVTVLPTQYNLNPNSNIYVHVTGAENQALSATVLKEDRSAYTDAQGHFTLQYNSAMDCLTLKFETDILKPNSTYHAGIMVGEDSYFLTMSTQASGIVGSTKTLKGLVSAVAYEHVIDMGSTVSVASAAGYIKAFNSDNGEETVTLRRISETRIGATIEGMAPGETYFLHVSKEMVDETNQLVLDNDMYVELRTASNSAITVKQELAVSPDYKAEIEFSSQINSVYLDQKYIYVVNGTTNDIVPSTLSVSGTKVKVIPDAEYEVGTEYSVVACSGIKDISGHVILGSMFVYEFTPVSYAVVDEHREMDANYKIPVNFNFAVNHVELKEHLYLSDGYHNKMGYTVEQVDQQHYLVLPDMESNKEMYISVSGKLVNADMTVALGGDIVRHYTTRQVSTVINISKWVEIDKTFTVNPPENVSVLEQDLTGVYMIRTTDYAVIPTTKTIVNNNIVITPVANLTNNEKYQIIISGGILSMNASVYEITTQDTLVENINKGTVLATDTIEIVFDKNVEAECFSGSDCFYTVNSSGTLVDAYTFGYSEGAQYKITATPVPGVVVAGAYKIIANRNAITYTDDTHPTNTKVTTVTIS